MERMEQMEQTVESGMRLFIEASLDPETLDAAWDASLALRQRPGFPAASVRWVKREALHLTLCFLGEVDTGHVDDVDNALQALSGAGAMTLCFTALTSFGGRRPRVIALGLQRGAAADRLAELRIRLDAALASLESAGIAGDQRPFHPHLTLARVRRQATSAELAAISLAIGAAPPLQIAAHVGSAALVESTLTADGPRYRRLTRAEL